MVERSPYACPLSNELEIDEDEAWRLIGDLQQNIVRWREAPNRILEPRDIAYMTGWPATRAEDLVRLFVQIGLLVVDKLGLRPGPTEIYDAIRDAHARWRSARRKRDSRNKRAAGLQAGAGQHVTQELDNIPESPDVNPNEHGDARFRPIETHGPARASGARENLLPPTSAATFVEEGTCWNPNFQNALGLALRRQRFTGNSGLSEKQRLELQRFWERGVSYDFIEDLLEQASDNSARKISWLRTALNRELERIQDGTGCVRLTEDELRESIGDVLGR